MMKRRFIRIRPRILLPIAMVAIARANKMATRRVGFYLSTAARPSSCYVRRGDYSLLDRRFSPATRLHASFRRDQGLEPFLAHQQPRVLISTRALSTSTTTTTNTTRSSPSDPIEPPAASNNAHQTHPNENKHEMNDQQHSSNTDSLKDAVRRMMKNQQQQSDPSSSSTSQTDSSSSSSRATSSWSTSDFWRNMADGYQTLADEVARTWQDLLRSGERQSINKKLTLIHPSETAGQDQVTYTGPVDLVVVDPSEHLSTWQRMQKRLTEAPIIQDILLRTEELYEKTGAKKVKQKVDHWREDAREAWETSQNPWVYRLSSVYDTLTAETPESLAVKELRQLDPTFTLDDWRRDVIEHTLPQIMEWFLEGRIGQLQPWLAPGVWKRLASEITARQKEGIVIDSRVLQIFNSEILACEPDDVNKGSPIIILHFMCQQINCVRRKSDGVIVEGAEDDIRANSYIMAFQREYNEERGELNWKIVDFRFNGAIAYL